MKSFIFSISFLLFATLNLQAQVDSTQIDTPVDTTASFDLLSDITSTQTDTMALLPDHFLFTQRMLWGERGALRNLDYFELSPQERERELKIRRTMLVTHQTLGMLTLAGMIAQGFVGASLYNGNVGIKDFHEGLAAGVNIGYVTTMSLALFAPPKMLNERKGYSSIKVHKALAMVHISSMIATNILAGMVSGNPSLRPYHRAAAYTAFGAFAASMIIIKF